MDKVGVGGLADAVKINSFVVKEEVIAQKMGSQGQWGVKVVPLQPEKLYGHPRFYEILGELKKLHNDKNHDYAGDDPLSNFEVCLDELDVPEWIGVLIRTGDKRRRISNYAKQALKAEILGKADVEKYLHVADESIIQTMKDLAVYYILMVILFEEAVSAREKDCVKEE